MTDLMDQVRTSPTVTLAVDLTRVLRMKSNTDSDVLEVPNVHTAYLVGDGGEVITVVIRGDVILHAKDTV